jgi:hypothetical protein
MRPVRAFGRAIAAVWHWLGGPWRSLKAFAVALVNMTRQQMRALFSVAMLGGIIALSFQNSGLILLVRSLLKDAAPGSLFGQMALNQQLWNNVIILVFCVSLALIVWGADYFTAKFKGFEASAGQGVDEARVAGARRVEAAAHDERKEIEQEAAPPTRATITDSGQIIPDVDFDKATE